MSDTATAMVLFAGRIAATVAVGISAAMLTMLVGVARLALREVNAQ